MGSRDAIHEDGVESMVSIWYFDGHGAIDTSVSADIPYHVTRRGNGRQAGEAPNRGLDKQMGNLIERGPSRMSPIFNGHHCPRWRRIRGIKLPRVGLGRVRRPDSRKGGK